MRGERSDPQRAGRTFGLWVVECDKQASTQEIAVGPRREQPRRVECLPDARQGHQRRAIDRAGAESCFNLQRLGVLSPAGALAAVQQPGRRGGRVGRRTPLAEPQRDLRSYHE